MNEGKNILTMKNISKAFEGVQALDNVTFEVLPGEIHALVGENGAGKTTLMRILSGATTADRGEIFWRGKKVDINEPADAKVLGISMIHQELAVIPYLDVGKNIFLGREPKSPLPGVINWKKLYLQSHEQLDRLGLKINPHRLVNSLTIAQKQVVEVIKALSMDSSLIVMDEPTSALTEMEVKTLFKHMKNLRKQGVSIIFISHRLEEVFHIADRLTVLRDGQLIGKYPLDRLNQKEVVRMMVGRDLTNKKQKDTRVLKEIILKLDNINSGNEVQGVSLKLHKGEILGITGLVGSGQTELADSIFGVRKIDSGQLWLEGKPAKIKSPSEAIQLGLGFVTEDRKIKGLFSNMAIWQNIVIASQKIFTRLGFIKRNSAFQMSKGLVNRLDIKTPGINQRVGNLSGGNQQKVIIARWLALKPKVLILNEPTRGIDVSAKAEIHHLLWQMAMSGVSILMISSELPEVLSISDRILVMREGRIVNELDPKYATQNDIMHSAAGSLNGN